MIFCCSLSYADGTLSLDADFINDSFFKTKTYSYQEEGYYSYVPYTLVAHGGSNDEWGFWAIDDLELYAIIKFEENDSTEIPELEKYGIETYDNSGAFKVVVNSKDDGEGKVDDGWGNTGTWTYTGAPIQPEPNYPISEQNPYDSKDDFRLYFSIKAGTGYNLFAMKDSWNQNQAIDWSTLNDFFRDDSDLDNLNGAGLSHISFWKQYLTLDTPGESPVPEPATLILLGFGMIGLAGISRRRLRK